MVELIIEETGFPKNRETLKEFQDSFLVPINEILNALPGNRILSGFVVTPGDGDVDISAGILLYKGKVWTSEAYTGSIVANSKISFFETIETMTFNVGTQTNPIYEDRPGKIIRTAKIGEHAGYTHLAIYNNFIRGRKMLEYLKAGTVYLGPVVYNIGATTYHINFGRRIDTRDYQVLANFRAVNPETNFNRAFAWEINNRTELGFDVIVNNATAVSVPLYFDYTVVPINRSTILVQNP